MFKMSFVSIHANGQTRDDDELENNVHSVFPYIVQVEQLLARVWFPKFQKHATNALQQKMYTNTAFSKRFELNAI